LAERPLTSAFIQSARRSIVWESGHALSRHADAARHRPTPPCSSKQTKIIILFAAEHACGCEGEAFCAQRILWRCAERLARVYAGAGRYVLHSRVYPLRVLGPFLDHGKLPLVPSAANSQWRATMEMSGSSPLPRLWPCARTLLLRVPGHHASERRPGVAPSSLAPSTRLFRAGTPQDTRRGSEVLCGCVRRHIGVATPGAFARRMPAPQPAHPIPRRRHEGLSPVLPSIRSCGLRMLWVLSGEVCPQGGGRS
jgi:hypothetical protein